MQCAQTLQHVTPTMLATNMLAKCESITKFSHGLNLELILNTVPLGQRIGDITLMKISFGGYERMFNGSEIILRTTPKAILSFAMLNIMFHDIIDNGLPKILHFKMSSKCIVILGAAFGINTPHIFNYISSQVTNFIQVISKEFEEMFALSRYHNTCEYLRSFYNKFCLGDIHFDHWLGRVMAIGALSDSTIVYTGITFKNYVYKCELPRCINILADATLLDSPQGREYFRKHGYNIEVNFQNHRRESAIIIRVYHIDDKPVGKAKKINKSTIRLFNSPNCTIFTLMEKDKIAAIFNCFSRFIESNVPDCIDTKSRLELFEVMDDIYSNHSASFCETTYVQFDTGDTDFDYLEDDMFSATETSYAVGCNW